MNIQELLKKKRKAILQLASLHGAKNIRLFGSVARGEDIATSDIDFLVEMEKGRTFLDLVGFWQDLEEMLGRKTDVITDGGISPYLRAQIYKEAKPL